MRLQDERSCQARLAAGKVVSKSIKHKPGRSTGPTSEAGKARSAKNAQKHGCCSTQLVLPNESQAEYDKLLQSWLADYPPADATEASLVEKACKAQWFLIRNRRRYNEIEDGIFREQPHAMDWTEEQHKQITNFRRYLTAAERHFSEAVSLLEARRGSRLREGTALQRAAERGERLWKQQEQSAQRKAAKEAKAEATELAKKEKAAEQEAKALTFEGQLFRGQSSPKKKKKVHVLEQWVEVRIEAGQTVTTLYPSNLNLIERGKAMWPPPDLVYRRFNFPDGVPEEYRWVGMTAERAALGGLGVQRMTPETWFKVTEREGPEIPREGYKSSIVPGHLGPTGVGNLPRPPERGGCECPVCQGNRAVLDRLAEDGP
jgi:hypothetical protein